MPFDAAAEPPADSVSRVARAMAPHTAANSAQKVMLVKMRPCATSAIKTTDHETIDHHDGVIRRAEARAVAPAPARRWRRAIDPHQSLAVKSAHLRARGVRSLKLAAPLLGFARRGELASRLGLYLADRLCFARRGE